MGKDLIIGGASNYNWNQLRYWVNSINKTNFKGDVVVVGSNISQETKQILETHGVTVVGYQASNQIPPHVERFLHIWGYLKLHEHYRYVTVTDTRDVIFQKDPCEFLSKNLSSKRIVVSSEGLRYKDEPWGRRNLFDAFDHVVFSELSEKLIYNVGTISGYANDVRDMMLHLYYMSINRPISIVDQATFNFLVSSSPYRNCCLKTTNKNGWAVQLGTSEGAVSAGNGDIGQAVINGSLNLDAYKNMYQDIQPRIENDLVMNEEVPFHIVHQWDRVPSVKELVERQYGSNKNEDYIIIRT
jgi:hypothetical protein